MKSNIFFIFLISVLLNVDVIAQTKSHGNYEVYTYEASRNGIGYLTTKINFPSYLGNYSFNQTGVLYTYQYFSNNIGAVNITNDLRVRFITEGNFNIGGGYSSTVLNSSLNSKLYIEEVKLYSGKIDLYAFDVATEATYVFKNGIGITLKFGMNIFSIGANAVFPNGGRVKDDMFGVVNLLPLIFKPQLLVDFGDSVFGLGFLIHSKNFVEYKYVPPSLFNEEDKGFIFNDNFITNYAFQLYYYY